MFAFGEEMTAVSYVPKKSKNVLVVSSMHHDDSIDPTTGDQFKPEIITFYNETKSVVDVVDRMITSYDVSRGTRRWTMVIFYGLLNVASINAFVIYKSNNPDAEFSKSRRLFQEALGRAVLHDNLQRRAVNPHIPRTTRLLATRFAGIEEMARDNPSPNRRGRCKYRPKRKTRFYCCFCRDWLCMEHIVAHIDVNKPANLPSMQLKKYFFVRHCQNLRIFSCVNGF
jgi:hypothetical protein